jgi:transcriptional regulator with XRE-family HTH domain
MAPLTVKEIGRKIKSLRKSQGLSQIELAGKIGVSFQQIQKYEKGSTRISVARLQEIANAIGVDITIFFGEGGGLKVTDKVREYRSEGDSACEFPPLEPEERVLLRLFRRIENKKIRESILKQLKGIVELQNGK